MQNVLFLNAYIPRASETVHDSLLGAQLPPGLLCPLVITAVHRGETEPNPMN
jgi:hypothetical protein